MEKLKAGILEFIELIGCEPEIHFEIGKGAEGDRPSHMHYSSASIGKILELYKSLKLSEADGYFIDVWEDGKPVADISMAEPSLRKVHFEINARIMVDLKVDLKSKHKCPYTEAVPTYDYTSVFKSDSAMMCKKEWIRKGYSSPEYSLDIREAPFGEESYHVADIDINSFKHEPPLRYGKEWLISLIKNHISGDKGKVLGMPEQLAERILQVYARGQD